MSDLRLETLTGAALRARLPDVVRLRAIVFREWPYLYDAGPNEEERYLRHYADGAGAAIVLAFAGQEAVGAATCQPMVTTHGPVRAAFERRGLDPARYCYFGESVVLREHRGRGVGVGFFTQREAHARALGLEAAAFCSVIRNPHDPRRPPCHPSLDGFWRRRGFTHHPDLACRMYWREVGDDRETPHMLSFWLKELR